MPEAITSSELALLRAIQSQTTAQRMSTAIDTAEKPALQVAAKAQERHEKTMEGHKKALDIATTRRMDMGSLAQKQETLTNTISSLNRAHGFRLVSSDTGITGFGLKGAAVGNYDVNLLQKAVKCRFVFEAATTSGVSSPWTADTDVVVANGDVNSSFNIDGSVGAHFTISQGAETKDITLANGDTLTQVVAKINTALEGAPALTVTAKIEVYESNKRRIVLESNDSGSSQLFTVSNNGNTNMFTNVGPKYAGDVVKIAKLKQIDGTSWDSSVAMNANTSVPAPNSVLVINNQAIPIGNYSTTDNTLTYLGNVIDDINRYAEDTGVFAVIVNDGGNDRYIELRRADGAAGIDINTSPSTTPFLEQACVEYTELSSQSVVEYKGARISSDTNIFTNNILSGVTLNMTNAKIGESQIKVTSAQDWTGALKNLVEKYNSLAEFINEVENDKDDKGLRQRKIWSSGEFVRVKGELYKIASHRMFIGTKTFKWENFGVTFGETATIDETKLDKALSEPANAQALENFLAGTARIGGQINDNTAGSNAIVRQVSTYSAGGSLSIGAGHAYGMADFQSVEVTFSGGDRTIAANYTATVHTNGGGTATIDALTVNSGVLEIRGNGAWADMNLDYSLPTGSAGYTDRVFATYLAAGAANASTSSLSLVSSGVSIDNMSKITSVAVRNNAGTYEAFILYDGKVAVLDGTDGTTTDNGGGSYTLTVGAGHADLANLTINYNETGDALALGQAQVFEAAFGSGLGSKASLFENTRDSFIRSVKAALRALDMAREKYMEKEIKSKDRMEMEIVAAQSKQMMNDTSHHEKLLESLLDI